MPDSVTDPPPQSHDNIYDDSTRSFFTPGSREVGEPDGDETNDNLTDRVDPSDDERHFHIDTTDRAGAVVWEDLNGQRQHTRDLRMSLYVDASEHQAIFKLHGRVFHKLKKHGKSNALKLYLFIYPENIKSVQYKTKTTPSIPAIQKVDFNNFISLRFSMTQPPSFVIPKGSPLVVKPQSQVLLDSMIALASVKDFTIYLNMLELVPEFKYQLSLLPSALRHNHNLKTDARRTVLQTLYHGEGGEVFEPGNIAAAPSPSSSTSIQETVEELPPPYVENGPLLSPVQLFPKSYRKRRRTSEPPSLSNRYILFDRYAELEVRLERLERMAQEPAARTPCRYNTQEIADIFDQVNNIIDDQLVGVQDEVEGKVMEGTEDFVAKKTEETQERFWDGIPEKWMEEIRKEVKRRVKREVKRRVKREVKREVKRRVKREVNQKVMEVLPGIRKEVFEHFAQAMRSAACGGDTKARMSFCTGNKLRDES